MSNILVFSQHFYPENFTINGIVKELVKRGNNVEVITGLPNYPEGKIYEGYKDKLEEEYFGAVIHRTKIRPRYKGKLNLYLNYKSYARKAIKTVNRVKMSPDFIFCFQSSPAFQLIPAIKAKHKFNCPLICMCLDLWPISLTAGGLTKGIIFNIIGNKCKKLYRECDHIINTSPAFIEYNNLVNKIPVEKMSWHFQPCEDCFDGIDTTKKNNLDYIDLMFAGNIGHVQNVIDIVKAYQIVNNPKMRIHIFGDGSEFKNVKSYVIENHLENNIILYGRLPKEEVNKRIVDMDACLLTLSDKTYVGRTIPSKFQYYLSANKPIIASVSNELGEIIKKENLGVPCAPDNVEELANILKFDTSKNVSREYYLKNGTIKSFVDFLFSVLKDFING